MVLFCLRRQLLLPIVETFVPSGASMDLVIEEKLDGALVNKISKGSYYHDSALSLDRHSCRHCAMDKAKMLCPLGMYALSCETLRCPRSLFPGQHGRAFTRSPSLRNPPKRDSVVKVLQEYSFRAGYNRNPRYPYPKRTRLHPRA